MLIYMLGLTKTALVTQITKYKCVVENTLQLQKTQDFRKKYLSVKD